MNNNDKLSQIRECNTPIVPKRIPPIARDNPFTLPPEDELFSWGDKIKHTKAAHRAMQKTLGVGDKTTFSHQMKVRTMPVRNVVSVEPCSKAVEDVARITGMTGPMFISARDRHLEKEDLADYVAKRREMFLIKYMLGVKKEEMGRLDHVLKTEESMVKKAEKYLEQDAQHLGQFEREIERGTDSANSNAIQEERQKIELSIQVATKKIELAMLQTDISKVEYKLEGLFSYKAFLNKLAPQTWREEKAARHLARREEYVKRKREEAPTPPPKVISAPRARIRHTSRSRHKNSVSEVATQLISARRRSSVTQHRPESQTSLPVAKGTDSDYESDDSCELYFTDPQQLLNIFAELEEQNLSLIQNNQETEEALDEIKQTIVSTEVKMNRETEMLKSQMKALKVQIAAADEKGREYEHRAKMFSYGEFNKMDQEMMLELLNDEVEKVYNECIGENEANISTLQMLTFIENRLEELFEHIETMPQWKIDIAEKAKSKDRRQKQKEDKLREQKLQQEERVARALERAQADRKVQKGKRLVFRSAPPVIKKKRNKEEEEEKKKKQEKEELAYYFEH